MRSCFEPWVGLAGNTVPLKAPKLARRNILRPHCSTLSAGVFRSAPLETNLRISSSTTTGAESAITALHSLHESPCTPKTVCRPGMYLHHPQHVISWCLHLPSPCANIEFTHPPARSCRTPKKLSLMLTNILIAGPGVVCSCTHANMHHHRDEHSMHVKQPRTQGAHRIAQWRSMDTAIAPTSHRLAHGGCTRSDWFSEMALRALNISTTTSTLIATVDGPLSSNIEHL